MGEETQDSSLSKLDSSQLEMMKEMCLVVDENDKVIDSVSKIDCHRGKGIRHRAFSVLIFDSEDRLLMQQRSIEKITFPGIWANSCCSHPLDIENENGDEIEGVIHASKRKMFQELGIPEKVSSGWDYNHIGRFEYSCRWDDEWIEHEIDHVLIVRASPELSINENEIMDTRWLTHEEINQMLEGENEWKNSIIAPWFRMIWKHFIEPHYPDMEALIDSNTSKIINCGRLSINSKSEGMELKSALGKHKIVVEKEIMKSMDKIRQERLHGAMTHLFTGGGKRFRAILPRLVGEATGSAHEGHYTLGSSIEIIHNFTLVHDDIMDQDPIRRGLNAVHVEYDDATAINAGDAMLAVGFEILADSDEISPENLKFLVQSIGEMVRRVAEGQQEDFDFEQRDYVSEEEYIAMIAGKTSAMFETCAETGAKLAGADSETVENMAEWGLKLGLCFQLMDDLIDITGDTETLGKPAGSDVVQGKKTLIAIHALDSGNDLPVFSKVYGKGECTDEDLAKAVEELRNNGSIDYAMDRAMRYHSEAHSILDGLESSHALEVLRQLTDMQLTRIN
ncbi:isopentenyl-diphosphate delta-isomerase [Euryarchaeota archaeon]|uniref:isopentenyl-diphosphate Delta-isomerase n=1 Tax=uncultured Poseidoniia archaeon TaxID=1697135 RepID=A0A1B1TCQ1_9ARCH|nr:putative Polyprenyl synthetase [uncultured Candidatus Thalassoarchaea sp.]MDC0059299.1 isopentenyl-diphosphate delta-isomerase [Euryarchaeota archaeon]|tara:strand:+ start:896 stop:2587 length:1692 start_codon:yes stop_codon:yes gene_type:complete